MFNISCVPRHRADLNMKNVTYRAESVHGGTANIRHFSCYAAAKSTARSAALVNGSNGTVIIGLAHVELACTGEPASA